MYLSKGQAEIIGGIIVLAVFISAIGLLYTTLMQLSSTSTKGFSERANFEAEKNIEKLTVDYDTKNKRCILANQGPIPLAIVRIWISGNSIDLDPLQLKPGEYINSIGGRDVDDVDIIVTNRGNVIEVRRTCEMLKKSRSESTPPPSSLFTSEEILNTFKISKGMEKGYLYVNITTGGATANKAIIYFNGSRWLCSSINNDKKIFNANAFTKISSRDVDGNSINEMITVDVRKCTDINDPKGVNEYDYSKGFTGYVNYMFKELIFIPENVDTIIVYFKFVMTIQGGGTPQEVSFSPTIRILGRGISISSPSTVSIASSSPGIAVISGNAIFPIKAFDLNIVEEETYSMVISIYINANPSLDLGVTRLEYLAITGAYIADPWHS